MSVCNCLPTICLCAIAQEGSKPQGRRQIRCKKFCTDKVKGQSRVGLESWCEYVAILTAFLCSQTFWHKIKMLQTASVVKFYRQLSEEKRCRHGHPAMTGSQKTKTSLFFDLFLERFLFYGWNIEIFRSHAGNSGTVAWAPHSVSCCAGNYSI